MSSKRLKNTRLPISVVEERKLKAALEEEGRRRERYCENPPGLWKREEFSMRQTGTLKTVSTTSGQDVGKHKKAFFEKTNAECAASSAFPKRA